MFKKSNQEETTKSAPKKKPAQPNENDNSARQNVNVKEGANEGECCWNLCWRGLRLRKVIKSTR